MTDRQDTVSAEEVRAPESDASVHALTVTLRELAWTVHYRIPDRAQVPSTELTLLKQIIDQPGSTVGQLSAALNIRQSNTSTAVRSLVERGFVERVPDTSDKRVVHIHATEQGETEHAEIALAWAAGLDDAIAALSPEQLQQLMDAHDALHALERIIRAN
ncbi:MarR family winged helix-turn-helix transcriptional regulator [Gulosibacter molinativorax]|uniref:MarR family transcriptional regulator n=1 Tax=Gulosibacter molinativorax TaxID=256821 RepID=A0ABT7C9P4_9MICO|nr:MarR family winged helix-turn-helix transcriptional regulator [Gulosibacter molinativorax]MDJ1371936.1 MarR family transcriptional regulator [Gulosibacter molinativorax]